MNGMGLFNDAKSKCMGDTIVQCSSYYAYLRLSESHCSLFAAIMNYFRLSTIVLVFTCLINSVFPQNLTEFKTEAGNEAVEILQSYVRIPSLSGHEKDAASYFSRQCSKKGLFVHRFQDEGSYNFIASLYPLSESKPNIIFLHHMDVVSPGDSLSWRYPPFSGAVSDGKVWGRGSIDNKSLGVIHLMAVSSFAGMADTADLPFNVSLLCVCGEETGGRRGSGIIAEKYLELINPVVVLGEGGSGLESLDFIGRKEPVFTISVADKSMLWLELSVENGNMGHASINSGDYAGKRLVRALDRVVMKKQPLILNEASLMMFWHIGEVTGGMKGYLMKNMDRIFFRPVLKHHMKKEARLASFLSNSVTLSHFRNPSVDPNQHAVNVAAMLDCRLLPGYPHEKMINWIEKRIKDTAVHIKVVHQGPSGKISPPGEIFSMLSASIKKIYDGADVIPVLFPASSDNDYYRNKGYLTYGLNPFIMTFEQIGSIHNVDENVSVDEMMRGIEVFKVFLGEILSADSFSRQNLSVHERVHGCLKHE
jgi:carboxypeptidase PM20D1